MKTLLTPPAKNEQFFFLKEKEEKSTPPLRDTARTYKGCTYLLCVNCMSGYSEDHNTTEIEKSSKYHMGKEQRNNDQMIPRI